MKVTRSEASELTVCVTLILRDEQVAYQNSLSTIPSVSHKLDVSKHHVFWIKVLPTSKESDILYIFIYLYI